MTFEILHVMNDIAIMNTWHTHTHTHTHTHIHIFTVSMRRNICWLQIAIQILHLS